MTTLSHRSKNTYEKLGRVGERPYWILAVSILLRAVHQVGASVYLASFLVEEIAGPPTLYLGLAIVSGVALLVTEGMRHRQIYREMSGLITFIKLLLLGLAFHGFLPAPATVLSAFFLAAIGAHVPKKIRHRLLY